MPHLHEKIDFTVEVYIVCGNEVLLRMHDKYKMWLAVGGHVELDEDPNQAAVREVKEEVGLDIALFDTRLETIPTTETFRDLIPPVFMNRHDINVTHEHIAMVYFARSTTKEVINQVSEHSDDIRGVSKADLASLDLSPQVSVYAKRALEVLGSQS